MSTNSLNSTLSGVRDFDPNETIKENMRKLKNLDKISTSTMPKNLSQDIDGLQKKIRELKTEKKKLKNTYSKLQNTNSQEENSRLKRLEEDVFQIRSKYDSLKSKREELEKVCKSLEGELKVISTKNHRKRNIQMKLKDIRRLENRLDKTIIKYNESLCIKETYSKILKRLQNERMGFDNQLRSIERTLKSKNNDYRELRQMYHEANYLKELSKNSLKVAKEEFMSIRKMKEKELEEKKKFVNSKIELTSKITQRETIREKLDLKSKGLMDKAEEDKFKKAEFVNKFADLKNDSELEKKQNDLSQLEKIYRKIKEVTGVNTTAKIISKFYSSSDTHKSLQKLTMKVRLKIKRMTKEKKKLKNELEKYKYAQNTGVGNKRVIDEFMQQLSESKNILEKNKEEYEKIHEVLVNGKSGLIHLYEKLVLLIGENPQKIEHEDQVEAIEELAEKSKNLLSKMEVCNISSDKKEIPIDDFIKRYTISEHNNRISLIKQEKEKRKRIDYPEDVDLLDRKQLKKLSALSYEKHKSKLAEESNKKKNEGK